MEEVNVALASFVLVGEGLGTETYIQIGGSAVKALVKPVDMINSYYNS